MSFQAEQQCRAERESCEINSNRCKANERYEKQRTDQCRANIVRKYENCKNRRLRTLAPLRSNGGNRPTASQIRQYEQRAVIQACGRSPSRGELQKSCPARGGGCYSRGYCTQQYQRCSSSAYGIDRSNAQQAETQRPVAAPPPPVRQRPDTARDPYGSFKGLPKDGRKIIVRKDTRPIIYKVSIENTCKKPIPVAYGILSQAEQQTKIRSWGWKSLKPGTNIIDFPEMWGTFTVYLKRGELFRIMKSRKLQAREHRSRFLYSLVEDQDFDVSYDYFNPPSNPNMRKVRFATLRQGFKRDMLRFKIKKCGKKRKVQSN